MSLNKTQYVVDTLDLLDDKDNCQRRIRIGKNKDMEIYKHDAECVIELKDGANVPLVFKNDNVDLMTLNNTGVSIETLTTATHVSNVTIQDLLIELGNGRTGDPSDDDPEQNPSGDSGIVMIRGDTGNDNAFMGFDDSENKFIMGTGTFTGATSGNLTITPGTLQVAGITRISTAGEQDLTIALAGATDSSLVLSSTGTGADALQLTTSAGGMDITSVGAIGIDTVGTAAINIGTEAAAKTITIGSDSSTKVDINALDIELDAGANGVTINSAGAVDITSDTITMASANANDPLVIIKNTTNDGNGARLRFVKDKGDAGADGDDIGIIEFVGDDAAQAQTTFAKIVAEVSEADNTDEAGKLSFFVAESDGTTTELTAGLVLEGEHATDGQVDVTIGAGAASTTTITGTLTANSGIESKNGALGSGFLNLYEDSDNGTHKITIIAPSAVTSDITLTLPDGYGASGQVLTTDDSGFLSWATASSNIDELTDGKSGGVDFTDSIILGHQTTGTLNAAERNTAVGIASMDAITSGDDNVCVGHDAGGLIDSGSRNTCIGSSAGDALTTGSNNTIIGYNAAASAVDADNEITLGNGSINTIRSGATTIASLSDRRDKTNIVNSNYGVNFIEKLRPVEFTWNRRILNKSDENNSHNGKNRLGFIAQELQEAMPNNENEILDLVYESNPNRLEVKQGNLVPILVKAIQELQAQVKTLQTAFDAIKN